MCDVDTFSFTSTHLDEGGGPLTLMSGWLDLLGVNNGIDNMSVILPPYSKIM